MSLLPGGIGIPTWENFRWDEDETTGVPVAPPPAHESRDPVTTSPVSPLIESPPSKTASANGNPLRRWMPGTERSSRVPLTGSQGENPLRTLLASPTRTRNSTSGTTGQPSSIRQQPDDSETPELAPARSSPKRSRFAPIPPEAIPGELSGDLPESTGAEDPGIDSTGRTPSGSAAMLMPPEIEPVREADLSGIQPLLSDEENESQATEEPSVPVANQPGTKPEPRSQVSAAGVNPDSKKDSNVVRVFYGTDRKPSIPSSEKAVIPVVLGGALLVASAMGMFFCYGRSRRSTLVCGGSGVLALMVLIVGLFRWIAPGHDAVAVRGYSSERGGVRYGYCDISIPPRHEFGEVERPSVFRLELRERDDRHVVIKRIEEQPAKQFFAALKETVQESSQKDLFVFVHGYNVTFDNAARRTAQMAHDLGFEGAPVFFSWPSQGEFSDYTVDENTITWAVPHLKEFLLDVVRQSDASRIHLIAHSMGNRALTAALRNLRLEFPNHPKFFQEIVLAAPDIDAEEFKNQIAPAIIPAAERITLYASSNDHALMASRLIHGFSRAGESGENLVIIPGIDTIDVSQVDESLLGHSYYGGSGPVLQDLQAIFRGTSVKSGRPWLLADEYNQLPYFRLEPLDGLARRPK